MGRFGERIGSYEAIAANLLFSTLIATTLLLLLRQSLAGFGEALHSPWWYWVGGGGMGVVVVFTITVVTPTIGPKVSCVTAIESGGTWSSTVAGQ